MMNNPKIITIIVHYNAPVDCLNLIQQLKDCNVPNHEIIISDNNSLHENYLKLEIGLNNKHIRLIKNNFNNGFGAGVNAAFTKVKHLNPDFLHIINTDVKIINQNYIQELLNKLINDTSIGLIGSAVYSNDCKNIQNTIMPYPSLKNALFFKKLAQNLSFIKTPAELIECNVINGVCFVIREDIFERINGFDEEYFMYGEEQDLCCKVKKNNLKVTFYSIPSIIHYGSENTNPEQIDWKYYFLRVNQLLFLKKNKKFIQRYILGILFFISLLMKRLKTKTTVSNNALKASIISYLFSISRGRKLLKQN